MRSPLVPSLALLLTLGGCSRSALAPVTDAAALSTDGASVPHLDAGACPITTTSTLPGVSLRFDSPRCRFTLAEAAAGIVIPYSVVVTMDLYSVVPAPSDKGGCGRPGASGLVVFERIAGGAEVYCRCDEGRCAPLPSTPVNLTPGQFPSQLAWDGRTWTGPSDTGNPEGPPFPPGTYTLLVQSVGGYKGAPGDRFSVDATLELTLTP